MVKITGTKNPNVSKITTIDPDTMAETVIFERKAGDEIIFRQNETLLKTGKWNEIINKLEKDGSKIRVSGSCKNPVLPTGNGYWTGTKGDSYWIPDDLYTPINIKTNSGGLSWAEIKNKYNISKVE